MRQRIAGIRKTISELGLGALLVSNFHNIAYLSGFRTLTENEREAWLLVTTDNCYVFSDSRYINDKFQMTNDPSSPSGLRRASKSVMDENKPVYKLITAEKHLIIHLKEIFREEGIKKLGIESDDLKYSEFQKISYLLSGTEIIPTEKLAAKLREVKNDGESEKLRRAGKLSDDCLRDVLKTIKIGSGEKEIAFRIEFWLKEKGHDLAFYPIVAIDANSALPHYDTRAGRDIKVKTGSVILIDFGAKYDGYLSDMTRMAFAGKPSDGIANAYKALLAAQDKTVAMCKSGLNCKDLDSYCRKELSGSLPSDDYNLPSNIYPHSTGHGVGLEIHEYPKLSHMSEDILVPGNVVTIEPGIYIEGKWGMRVEDTILIKKDSVETLTNFGKEMLIT